MSDYEKETMELAGLASAAIAEKFVTEVARLLNSGALDKEHHNRGLLFGIALENIADGYLRGERGMPIYRNLKRF